MPWNRWLVELSIKYRYRDSSASRWLSMIFSRRYTRITYEGVSFLSILAFIVLGSILRQINLLVLLSGLMIAPFFFNWRISLKMLERVRFTRQLPPWVHAGKPFVVQWTGKNYRTRVASWEIKISDRIGRIGGRKNDNESVDMIMPQILPGSSASGSYRCLIASRGIYEFGPAVASSAFPIGLVRSRTKLNEVQQLTVAPQLGLLTQDWYRLIKTAAVGLRSENRRRGVSNDEFYALRPWQMGDSRRLIHWRSSAKRGEMLVRQFDQRTNRDFGLVLDLWADEETTEQLVELAVSFMATVVSKLQQHIKRETVIGILGDDSMVIEERMTRFATQSIMDLLATIQPSDQTGIVTTLNELANSPSRVSSTIVVSTRPTSLVPDFDKLAGARGPVTWIDVSSESGRQMISLAEPASSRSIFSRKETNATSA